MAEKEDLIAIVGADGVSDDPEVLEAYSRDHSFVPSRKPLYVVYPQSGEQIQKLVQWANESRIPLTPVSSAPPRFRGDTVPAYPSVIVDMSKMKKIIRIDVRNRAVVVEPGVTYGELIPELEKEGLRMVLPLFPRASKSALASALEREPGIIPKYQWDMSDPLLTMEVFFGTGDMFRCGTASAFLPGEKGRASVMPLGPGQIDLFRMVQGSQGTFGIVPWATLKCEVVPTVQKFFFIPAQSFETLADPMYRFLKWKVGDECFVLNNVALATILTEDPEEFQTLRDNLPPWTLTLGLAGYRVLPEERLAEQEGYLMQLAQDMGFEPSPTIPGAPGKESVIIEGLSKAWSEESYWKLRYKGGREDIIFLTTLDRVPDFTKAMQEVASEYGYSAMDIGSYIQPVNQGHSCHCEFSFCYDPENLAERERAKNLSVEACERLLSIGAFFSRPYGQVADMVYSKDTQTVIALKKLKGIFDPNNVMNRGKLVHV